MKMIQRISVLSAAILLASNSISHGGKLKGVPEKPDLTKATPKLPEEVMRYAMGSTGALGWMYHGPGFNYDGVTQILVTEVPAGTPAEGKLQKDDVILGAAAGTKPKAFTKHARNEFGLALLEAESEAKQGQLALKVWRSGKTMDVQLKVPVVKGAYDAQKPLSSPRVQTLINDLAASIERKGLANGIEGRLDALGLLATGDAKYHPMLKAYAHSLKPEAPLDLNERGKQGWYWGYSTLFLAEYYGATGDKSILPILEEYATKLAMGQAFAGTWNHTMANPDLHDNEGKLNGRLGGYGAINQTTVACAIGLAVAQKVGVDNEHISAAVLRSKEHFQFFVEKGGIPYGDDPPTRAHSSNGKNAATGVFLDLVGDEKGAKYFSRMTLASHPRREGGHTGHYFGQLWGGLGAACGGEEALNAFTKVLQPYHQLERRPGAVCLYQPVMNAQMGKYRGWSMNGIRLLQYCVPRKALHITGKSRTTSPLTQAEIADSIDLESLGLNAETPTQELLELLGSWSPVVRRNAAMALGEKDDDVVTELITMLDSNNRYARYGACVALQFAGRNSTKAVDALIEKGFNSPDPQFQFFAASAFSLPRSWVTLENGKKGWEYPKWGLGKAAAKGANPLLELSLRKDPKDPRRKLQFVISNWLFYGGGSAKHQGLLSENGAGDLKSVDRELLLKATRSMLSNQNKMARSAASYNVFPTLTKEELAMMREDVVEAVRHRAPSRVGGGIGVRADGIKLLSAVHDPLVPELCNKFLMAWDKGSMPKEFIEPLKDYGADAKVALPGLKRFLARKQGGLRMYEKKVKKNEKKGETGNADKSYREIQKEIKYLEGVIHKIENAT